MKKKRKCRYNDRLTSLPESLITSLLFPSLSMKEALSLCYSCKSLEPLWASIPSLEFRDGPRFAENVSRFLKKRVSSIHSLTLSFNPNEYTSEEVTEWCELLKQIGVHKIVLDFVDKFYKTPSCLFDMENLRVLELESCTLKIPAQFVGFCLLEELHLAYVRRVKDHELTFLVSKCPKLKSLNVCGCGSLTKISVLDAESKLETLCLEGCGNCSEVNVPSLETFCYSDVKIYFHVEDGTKPTTIKIDRGSDGHPKDGEVSSMKNKLLKNLKHVQYLSLTGSAFTCFALGAVSIMPTEYSSLVKIEVELSLTDQNGVQGLFCLLERARHVESLSIKMKDVSDKGEDLADWGEGMNIALACGCLNTLKQIHIRKLGGKAELKLVKLLVANAAQLQIMTITTERQKLRGNLIIWRNLTQTFPESVKIVVNENI